MDKNAIKRYCIWARRELIEKVTQKALQYGIESGKTLDPSADSINGNILSDIEKKQRQALINKINNESFSQVIEEVAYTWFNRFVALRFMEVNGYLPSHVRVFTDENDNVKPQILSEALHLEIESIDKNIVYEMKSTNQDEELFKYLLIIQCNELNGVLPVMFQRIADYSELLLPDYLLRDGSVIEQLVSIIPEDDWKDQVQIIGWMYQYYNSEPKDTVFSELRNKKKVTKENIPAATQLFTPDWIVRYLVENSLGKVWYTANPSDNLKEKWELYVNEAEQLPEIAEQFEMTHKKIRDKRPEDFLCLDPCMGSGHILVYMFDVLIDIYEAYGYSSREAAALILENNIWGLDIDERAAQLASFALMMKARQYDRRIFGKNIRPHVYAIEESNKISKEAIEYFGNTEELRKNIHNLTAEMRDAKNYGSLIKINNINFELLINRIGELKEDNTILSYMVLHELETLIQIGKVLSKKYDAVITNPPYMNSGSMNEQLLAFVKKNYSSSKADLYSAFIERCREFLNETGIQGMVTQHSWMFLSRFEELRAKVCEGTIINMAHLGTRAFDEISGEVVQTTAFTIANRKYDGFKGTYLRLIDGNSEAEKYQMFLSGEDRYVFDQNEFGNIPGNPIAYWVSDKLMDAFKGTLLNQIGQTRQGFATGGNDDFLRYWFEVDFGKIGLNRKSNDDFMNSDNLYAPCNKGGEARKWYGNNNIVCKFDRAAYEKLLSKGNHLPSREYYFREGLTWSTLGSNMLSMRYSPSGFVFETKGSMLFTHDEDNLFYLLGLLNSSVAMEVLKILCPTIDFHEGPVSNVPVIIQNKEEVTSIVKENIGISKADWDSYELSWDFKKNPLISDTKKIEDAFNKWQNEANDRFETLRKNEEAINEMIQNAYGLGTQIDPSVLEKNVTVSRADLQMDIRYLISYAVGCMFGRYSLDKDGLMCTNKYLNLSEYNRYIPDADNIIPICDDEYFSDDIVGRFIEFVKAAYGERYLEENLQFIADALGGKGTARDVIRAYFITNFYKDHLKIYQKRPIYWMFDSGKKNGFKCLIYAHRYKADTLARIRTDYVHEQQSRYRTEKEALESKIGSASIPEKVKLSKQIKNISDQEEELHLYEEQIHHLADQMIDLDLDDGIKPNYEKIKSVLAKI